MATEKVLELTDSNFEETIKNSSVPVLVDFWAAWCSPCRRIAPIVEELAEQYDGKLIVSKVNIDDHQETANKLGVKSIPTLMVFKNGELAERIIGLVPKEELVGTIEKVL